MKKKTIVILAAAILILIVGAGLGLGIYNSPANRLSRQLDLGQKYLEEMDYEQAKIAFEKAIEIDPKCTEAYLGDADAHLGMNSYQSAFDILKQGLGATDGDETLISDYISVGMECLEAYQEKKDYENALNVFDSLLIYNSGDEVKSALEECIWQYIEILLEKKDYDTILKLSDRYQNVIPGLDSESITGKIEVSRKLDLITDSLVRIAKNCKNENYESIFEIMESEEFENVIAYGDEFEDLKAYDTGYGKIGLYSVDAADFGNHMIYYGDYDGEIREGEGVWIGYCDGNNYYSVGEWKNDLPNGKQCVREWKTDLAENVVYRVIDGTVNDGLWNGPVNWIFELDGEQNIYPVSFTNGQWNVIKEDPEDPTYYIVCDGEEEVGSLVIEKTESEITVGLAGYAVDN